MADLQHPSTRSETASMTTSYPRMLRRVIDMTREDGTKVAAHTENRDTIEFHPASLGTIVYGYSALGEWSST